MPRRSSRKPPSQSRRFDPQAVLLAYVQCDDSRGGGVETSFKDDQHGLGMTKRNKKRFAAQQMVVLLGSRAHNVMVWARGWLSDQEPKVRRYGLKCMQVWRIKCAPGKAHEVAQRIEEQFVPQMRTVSGFVAYYLVDVGSDEVSSISIFQNQAGADEANQKAGAWVKQSLGDITAGPLEARAGAIGMPIWWRIHISPEAEHAG